MTREPGFDAAALEELRKLAAFDVEAAMRPATPETIAESLAQLLGALWRLLATVLDLVVAVARSAWR